MAGPALPARRLVNYSIHRWEGSLHYLVARVHPTVKRLHLEFDSGFPEGMDLHPVAKLTDPDISIMAAILPNSPDITNISAWDREGRRVDERRTDRYGEFFKQTRKDHNPANDEIGDRWEPAP